MRQTVTSPRLPERTSFTDEGDLNWSIQPRNSGEKLTKAGKIMEAHTADLDDSEGAAGGRGGILTCDDLVQQEKG